MRQIFADMFGTILMICVHKTSWNADAADQADFADWLDLALMRWQYLALSTIRIRGRAGGMFTMAGPCA